MHNPTGWIDPFGLTSCPPPEIKGSQIGFKKPHQIDSMKKDMLDGTYDFKNIKNIIGGEIDSKGVYYVGDGHHRMAAAQEIYKETGDATYIHKLIEHGRWDKVNSPTVDVRPMPSRGFFGNLRNKLGF
ncbi:hypothetical protein [Xenorhabdus szentirmaii]|uniref:Rhs-family protein n=1 Tax=Xenorhabdus szentirmaii DSM 16338 TaxID=1427518 RepID=W1ITT5_9GAMM